MSNIAFTKVSAVSYFAKSGYNFVAALRLYPIQPSNSRVAYKDTVLPLGGGVDGLSPIFVARQTMVHFSVYTLHRRRDLWGNDADEFRPERWANEKHTWVSGAHVRPLNSPFDNFCAEIHSLPRGPAHLHWK